MFIKNFILNLLCKEYTTKEIFVELLISRNFVRIKIPKNIKGVGLCIESYSNFPDEQEIILNPLTKLKRLMRN
jgi:hypothetical protein